MFLPLFVCLLSVSKLTRKVMNRFELNLQEILIMAHKETD